MLVDPAQTETDPVDYGELKRWVSLVDRVVAIGQRSLKAQARAMFVTPTKAGSHDVRSAWQ